MSSSSTHAERSIDLRGDSARQGVPCSPVVTDRTAAWLHGVDAHTYGEHDAYRRPSGVRCAATAHDPPWSRRSHADLQTGRRDAARRRTRDDATAGPRSTSAAACAAARHSPHSARSRVRTTSRAHDLIRVRAALPPTPWRHPAPRARPAGRRRGSSRSARPGASWRIADAGVDLRSHGLDRDRRRADVPPRPCLRDAGGSASSTTGTRRTRPTSSVRTTRRAGAGSASAAGPSSSSARATSPATRWTTWLRRSSGRRSTRRTPTVVGDRNSRLERPRSPRLDRRKSRLNVRPTAPARSSARRCRR